VFFVSSGFLCLNPVVYTKCPSSTFENDRNLRELSYGAIAV
jgi:hypothetical protein